MNYFSILSIIIFPLVILCSLAYAMNSNLKPIDLEPIINFYINKDPNSLAIFNDSINTDLEKLNAYQQTNFTSKEFNRNLKKAIKNINFHLKKKEKINQQLKNYSVYIEKPNDFSFAIVIEKIDSIKYLLPKKLPPHNSTLYNNLINILQNMVTNIKNTKFVPTMPLKELELSLNKSIVFFSQHNGIRKTDSAIICTMLEKYKNNNHYTKAHSLIQKYTNHHALLNDEEEMKNDLKKLENYREIYQEASKTYPDPTDKNYFRYSKHEDLDGIYKAIEIIDLKINSKQRMHPILNIISQSNLSIFDANFNKLENYASTIESLINQSKSKELPAAIITDEEKKLLANVNANVNKILNSDIYQQTNDLVTQLWSYYYDNEKLHLKKITNNILKLIEIISKNYTNSIATNKFYDHAIMSIKNNTSKAYKRMKQNPFDKKSIKIWIFLYKISAKYDKYKFDASIIIFNIKLVLQDCFPNNQVPQLLLPIDENNIENNIIDLLKKIIDQKINNIKNYIDQENYYIEALKALQKEIESQIFNDKYEEISKLIKMTNETTKEVEQKNLQIKKQNEKKKKTKQDTTDNQTTLPPQLKEQIKQSSSWMSYIGSILYSPIEGLCYLFSSFLKLFGIF